MASDPKKPQPPEAVFSGPPPKPGEKDMAEIRYGDGIQLPDPARQALLEKLLIQTAEGQAQIAALLGRKDESEIASRKAMANIVERQEADAARDKADEERARLNKEWCNKSTRERTQGAADGRYPQGPGTHRFHVVLVEGRNEDGRMGKRKGLRPTKAFPDVLLWARSKEEARMCYMVVCGITGIDGNARLKTEIRVSEPNQKLNLEEAFDPLVKLGVAGDPLERELAKAGVEIFGG